MNIQQIVSELEKKYPGKNIIVDEGGGYAEIVVELELTTDHPDHSLSGVETGRPYFAIITS